MYNNNSDFYEHCCCYPENWNYNGEDDERYYRGDNHSQWESWDNRKENNEQFDSYGRVHCYRGLNCKNYDRNHNCCCCNNFCRENMEQKEKPRPKRSNCGCCLCKIFRIRR